MPTDRTGGAAALARSVAFAGIVVLACAAFAGCGERKFEDEELIDELNAAGAGLLLGESLPATSDDVAVTTVSFMSPAAHDPGPHEHAAGAVAISADEDAAVEAFDQCQAAVDFTCFRAGNAVIRFTGITPDEQARLTAALQSLEG
jgi:hypothetical protein